jgi:hypothetical protein
MRSQGLKMSLGREQCCGHGWGRVGSVTRARVAQVGGSAVGMTGGESAPSQGLEMQVGGSAAGMTGGESALSQGLEMHRSGAVLWA